MHCVFESGAPVIEQLMNTAGLEQIPNTQEHFDVIQRFVQKIGCTTMQGPAFGFLVDVGREDNDWQVNLAPIGTKDSRTANPSRCGMNKSSRIKSGSNSSQSSRTRRESVVD